MKAIIEYNSHGSVVCEHRSLQACAVFHKVTALKMWYAIEHSLTIDGCKFKRKGGEK